MQSHLDPSLLPATLQALPPAQARFCLAVSRFLVKELGLVLTGTRLLAGFSGGPDSTALLLALHYLAPKLDCTLFAAHLDHSLRPSSAQEAELCRSFCQGLGISFRCGRRDVRTIGKKAGTGLEESARAERYAFYAEAAETFACDWIVVGHTADDLAEDILMRLIRGAGWPALAGMAAVDRERRLLRPLLLTPKSAIERFLSSLGLAWIIDESNTDEKHFRNRVRKRLLPLILQENPAFLENAAGLWRLGRSDGEYFSAVSDARPSAATSFTPASAIISEARPQGCDAYLSEATLSALPKALRLRLYKKILAGLGPGQALLAGLLALDDTWAARKGGAEHYFPGGKKAVIRGRGIAWSRRLP
jgi:tRNA(Ile)-lysidine synthase